MEFLASDGGRNVTSGPVIGSRSVGFYLECAYVILSYLILVNAINLGSVSGDVAFTVQGSLQCRYNRIWFIQLWQMALSNVLVLAVCSFKSFPEFYGFEVVAVR